MFTNRAALKVGTSTLDSTTRKICVLVDGAFESLHMQHMYARKLVDTSWASIHDRAIIVAYLSGKSAVVACNPAFVRILSGAVSMGGVRFGGVNQQARLLNHAILMHIVDYWTFLHFGAYAVWGVCTVLVNYAYCQRPPSKQSSSSCACSQGLKSQATTLCYNWLAVVAVLLEDLGLHPFCKVHVDCPLQPIATKMQ